MANPKSYRDQKKYAPEQYEDKGLSPASAFSTNARDEREFEDLSRLPGKQIYDWESGTSFEVNPALSTRVKDQVLNSVAARSGAMTFASQLDRSRGVGTLGDTGGVQSRGSGAAGEESPAVREQRYMSTRFGDGRPERPERKESR